MFVVLNCSSCGREAVKVLVLRKKEEQSLKKPNNLNYFIQTESLAFRFFLSQYFYFLKNCETGFPIFIHSRAVVLAQSFEKDYIYSLLIPAE